MANNILVKPDPIQDYKFTTVADMVKGQAHYVDNFHGVVAIDAASGQEAILDISSRVWQMDLTGITIAKGAILYITTAGVLTASASTNRPFGRLTSAKDTAGIADVYILPQPGTNAS